MPKVRVNGAELHYEDVGSGPETLLFSHGLLFSTRMFDRQVEALRDRYRCISYDHRGQGQSELTASGYDMDTLAADAIALIEHLKVAPVHFVGLSMGGFVGMRLAARRPELVKSLVLLDTSAGPEPEQNKPRYKALHLLWRFIGFRLLAPRVMPIMFGQKFLKDPARAGQRAQWRDYLAARNREGVGLALGGVTGRKPILDELKHIRCPSLVAVGDQDVATVPAKAEELHANLPGSRLVIIPGAGHSSTIEEPEFVNAQLEAFLGQASRIAVA